MKLKIRAWAEALVILSGIAAMMFFMISDAGAGIYM